MWDFETIHTWDGSIWRSGILNGSVEKEGLDESAWDLSVDWRGKDSEERVSWDF
jgi:hypothetical protein